MLHNCPCQRDPSVMASTFSRKIDVPKSSSSKNSHSQSILPHSSQSKLCQSTAASFLPAFSESHMLHFHYTKSHLTIFVGRAISICLSTSSHPIKRAGRQYTSCTLLYDHNHLTFLPIKFYPMKANLQSILLTTESQIPIELLLMAGFNYGLHQITGGYEFNVLLLAVLPDCPIF